MPTLWPLYKILYINSIHHGARALLPTSHSTPYAQQSHIHSSSTCTAAPHSCTGAASGVCNSACGGGAETEGGV